MAGGRRHRRRIHLKPWHPKSQLPERGRPGRIKKARPRRLTFRTATWSAAVPAAPARQDPDDLLKDAWSASSSWPSRPHQEGKSPPQLAGCMLPISNTMRRFPARVPERRQQGRHELPPAVGAWERAGRWPGAFRADDLPFPGSRCLREHHRSRLPSFCHAFAREATLLM